MRSQYCTCLILSILLGLSVLGGKDAYAARKKSCEDLQQQYDKATQEIVRLQQALQQAEQRLAGLTAAPGKGLNGSAADFFHAGLAYLEARQYTEALNAFTKTLTLAPENALAYRQRGVAATYLGNYAQARGDLTTAIDKSPEDAIAYNQRGIVAYANSEWQAAYDDFSRAITLQPKLAEAYNNRSIVQRHLGNYVQAMRDSAQAGQLGLASAAQHQQLFQEEVRQAQERLRDAGENPGPADGMPGAQTTTALRQYQQARGLPVSGLLDEATRLSLGLGTAALAPGSSSEPRFVHQPKPQYPPEARQNGWEGTVTLRLEMRADGTVGQVAVAKSSGYPALDNAAQEAAHTWKHEPARQNGTAITRWVELSLTFALDNKPAEAPRQ